MVYIIIMKEIFIMENGKMELKMDMGKFMVKIIGFFLVFLKIMLKMAFLYIIILIMINLL